jgi:hypothetical protein
MSLRLMLAHFKRFLHPAKRLVSRVLPAHLKQFCARRS